MTNIKVTALPPDMREKLGYNAVPAANGGKSGSAAASAWAKKTISSIQVPQLKQLEQVWQHNAPAGMTSARLNSTQVMLVLGGFVLLYLLMSCCYALICKNAGKPAGAMIWIPVVQLIPLLAGAGMAGWWSGGFLRPGINRLGAGI